MTTLGILNMRNVRTIEKKTMSETNGQTKKLRVTQQ